MRQIPESFSLYIKTQKKHVPVTWRLLAAVVWVRGEYKNMFDLTFLCGANDFYEMKAFRTTTATFCCYQKTAALVKQLLVEH